MVVADDGSSDGTKELVEALRSKPPWSDDRLRWVSTGLVPRGLSRARNIGVGNAASSATHVVTLDADVVLEPSALDRLWCATVRHSVAAVFGIVNWLPQDARRSVAGALRRGRADALRGLVPDITPTRVGGTIVGPDPRPAASFAPADEATSTLLDPSLALNTFCAFPLSVVDAVGGWDETLTGYGYEDMELGARLRRIGTEAVYVADAVGFHLWHPRNWSRGAIEGERNLDYVLRRLGPYAVSDAYANWTVWWHYHREREGALWAVGGRHYALNRARTHALLLPDPHWISRLGYEQADARPASEEELNAKQVAGSAGDLPMSRMAAVEPLP